MKRVVSLVPSITETLRAWGLDPIACTRFCEQPDLPTVGGTKNPDIDAIVALAPDVVAMDRHENRREDASALEGAGFSIVALDVRRIEDLDRHLARLAAAVELPPPASGTSAIARPTIPVATAFVPIWRRPWMTINGATYGSSVLDAIGIANVFADAPDDYPTIELDEVRRRAPDVVLAPSEPYVFTAQHLDELRTVAPVVEVDGQDLFWWGARTPAALDRLAAALGRIAP